MAAFRKPYGITPFRKRCADHAARAAGFYGTAPWARKRTQPCLRKAKRRMPPLRLQLRLYAPSHTIRAGLRAAIRRRLGSWGGYGMGESMKPFTQWRTAHVRILQRDRIAKRRIGIRYD